MLHFEDAYFAAQVALLLLTSPKWTKDGLKILKQIIDDGFPDLNKANKVGRGAASFLLFVAALITSI